MCELDESVSRCVFENAGQLMCVATTRLKGDQQPTDRRGDSQSVRQQTTSCEAHVKIADQCRVSCSCSEVVLGCCKRGYRYETKVRYQHVSGKRAFVDVRM